MLSIAAGLGAIFLFGGLFGVIAGVGSILASGILMNFSNGEIMADQAPKIALVLSPVFGIASIALVAVSLFS